MPVLSAAQRGGRSVRDVARQQEKWGEKKEPEWG
jgi:hypothetical protein